MWQENSQSALHTCLKVSEKQFSERGILEVDAVSLGLGQVLMVLNDPKHTFAVCTGSSVLNIVTRSWQSSVPGGKSLGSLLCTELTAPHLQDSGRQRPQHLETAFRRLVG